MSLDVSPAAPIEYATPRSASDAPVLWPLLVAGMVESVACVAFAMVGYGIFLFAGFTTRADEADSPTTVHVGLIAQLFVGVALAIACAITLVRPTVVARVGTRCLAALLGCVTLYLGVANIVWQLAANADVHVSPIVLLGSISVDLFVEAQKEIVPILLIIVCDGRCTGQRVARTTWVGLLFACVASVLTFISLLVADVARFGVREMLSGVNVWLLTAFEMLFGIAAVLMIVSRGRAWLIAASMPLAIHLAAWLVQSYQERTSVRDNVSLLTAVHAWSLAATVSSGALAGFLLFTVARVPRPTLYDRPTP